jgi:hypothetical protein
MTHGVLFKKIVLHTMEEKMRKVISLLFLFGSCLLGSNLPAHAEETPLFNPTGSVNLVYGTSSIVYSGQKSHSIYLNFAGPSLTLVSGEIGFGGSFFPSLKMIMDPPAAMNSFAVALGVGPWISYRKMVLTVPFYFASPTATDVGIGIGYRF